MGTTVPHLNQVVLLKYKIILPPIELQEQFADFADKVKK
ncbi:restriction endonuclease subunit S [Fusobacterium animalis]